MMFLLLALVVVAAIVALAPRRMTPDLKPIPVKVEDKRPRRPR